MAEVHDGVLTALIDAVGIQALIQIVRGTGTVPEGDRLIFAVDDLIKIVVCIVDDQRRCPRKVAVCPGIGKHVHGKAGRGGPLPFCKFHRVLYQRTVGLTDQTVLVLIALAGLSRRFGRKVTGQEVERGPDTRDVLQTDQVGPGLHELELQLGRSRGHRPFDLFEEGARAQIRHLIGRGNLKALFRAPARQHRGTEGGKIVKILLHLLSPPRSRSS